MFDGIVEALVERISPAMEGIGTSICQSTQGLITQWEAYEFMCRNVPDLAVLTIEHIIVTLISILIAVLLGVLIGVRVSSSPWPERGSTWYLPVVVLAAAFVVAGVLALVLVPESAVELEQFKPANPRTWTALLQPGQGLAGVMILVQSVLAIALGSVLVVGIVPGGDDWRLLVAAVAGALVGPMFIPRPILHTILVQVYRLVALLPLGDALGVIAQALNRIRDAAPLWALIAMVLLMGQLSKQLTWRSYLVAALGGYVVPTVLGVFVMSPGAEGTLAAMQLVLFGLLALVILMGEHAADSALYVVGVIFTIPSLAMFGIMIPILGIGVDPAVVALVLYGLLPILRNTIIGLRELDPAYTESGRGMGMTDFQLLTKVRLPLTLPVILAGVRVSMVMTVGLASIATLIGAGGLGELIFQGISRTNPKMVLTGAIWISILALLADFVMGRGETAWVSPGIRREPDQASQESIGV